MSFEPKSRDASGPGYRIAIVGSGPGGLSAAAHAAELGLSHVLLEAQPHLSSTIYRYQKGKHVMAEPSVLPLRSPLEFAAGKREHILDTWNQGAEKLGINRRHQAEVTAISGSHGAFMLKLADGSTVQAEHVVLAIGLQGNLRKLGCPGEDAPQVQYQLDDPDEYQGETIAVVGAGDAAIENALALADHNQVVIVNRRDSFDRAKDANEAAILAAINRDRVRCFYNAGVAGVQPAEGGRVGLVLSMPQGNTTVACDRIIARLGATPPRRFVEGCGVRFPSDDPNCVPAVSPTYESNVPGLYIVGALAGFPLIKQALNQGFEVVEYIEGRRPEPVDAPLLREKFKAIGRDVDAVIELIRGRIPLLSSLTALQLREFLLDSRVLTPKPGDVIFRRNDYSDTFYCVLDGEAQVQPRSDPNKRFALRTGEFFGEMSLISGRRRSATVLAGSPCVLIESPRRSMRKLVNSVAAVQRTIDEAFLRRAIQARIAPGLPADDLAELVASARIERFEAGATVFREGEPGDALHLIRSGSVTIAREIGGREVVLAYVPAGQYVGEMALISELPRSATVKAAVATETIRLDGAAFKQLMMRRTVVRDQALATYRQRLTQNVVSQSQAAQGNVISFLMAQGLGEATDVLLIDEALCVRCDQCEKACADTHGNVSRLNREAGPTFANVHVPTSCRHCEHPHCMKDCPPDAIHRSSNGEVFITEACIGCGNCERNCPYGVIQMGTPEDKRPSLWRWLLFGGTEPGMYEPLGADASAKKAVKCDMCKDLAGGPACVRACPTGAALRVSPEEFLKVSRGAAA